MKRIITLIAALSLSGCFRPEVRTSDYHIPALTNATTASIIETQLKQMLPGTPQQPWIVRIEANLETHVMTIEYLSTYVRAINMEESIAAMGFDVNLRPAHPAAKAKREQEKIK